MSISNTYHFSCLVNQTKKKIHSSNALDIITIISFVTKYFAKRDKKHFSGVKVVA